MSDTPRTDDQEAKFRAEWLNKHEAPKEWIVLTNSEVSIVKKELATVTAARDEAVNDSLLYAVMVSESKGQLTAAQETAAKLREVLKDCLKGFEFCLTWDEGEDAPFDDPGYCAQHYIPIIKAVLAADTTAVPATGEKCPVCNGVPEKPEIEGCHGCIHCDFTGTKDGYDAMTKTLQEPVVKESLTAHPDFEPNRPNQHNPDRLMSEQYGAGEGWRLLDEDEIHPLGYPTQKIEAWARDAEYWQGNQKGYKKEWVYRTKLTRSDLRAARGLDKEQGE